jgi:Di-haem oxidoreductase, putative peroxidase
MQARVRLVSFFLLAAAASAAALEPVRIGERPAIEHHLDQADIDAGKLKLAELMRAGQKLFDAQFNKLDGAGRPGSMGDGGPRSPNQPPFTRISGPEANSCFGCHSQPRSGGAGDFVANVFVLGQERDPVVTSLDVRDSNERNTLGMMGAGPIEMLAREMTADLIAIREQATREAKEAGQPVRHKLTSKGVSFGTLLMYPDGRIDPREIDGVDWDLIVKPFHQKGAVVSLRDFSNTAMNHHHGMQSVERFGKDLDPDKDGVVNELTVGDITALTIYQAGLNTPGRLMPREPARRAAVVKGERLFDAVHCTSCHVPFLELDSPVFTEPNPYNPLRNLAVADVPHPFSFDMTREGPAPRLSRMPNGHARVHAFTDLKRHDISDGDYNHFANERAPQGMLTGVAAAAAFTQPPQIRPLRQFLTHKLWDVGNSGPYGHRGDLTTITEAIYFHGGEARASRDAFFALPQANQDAVIEFLKTLQILPDGSKAVVVEVADR